MIKKVSVNHEWGTLREVIVGSINNLTVPVWTDEYTFAPLEEQKFVRKFGGKSLLEVAPQRYHKISKQLDDLARFLIKLDITVHRPRAITTDEELYLSHIRNFNQQLFPRDPILVIGNNVIETAMRDPAERKNKWAIREIFYQQLKDYKFNYVAMPEPLPVVANKGFGPGPFLEGGDTLLCGYDIFVGSSGHASNDWGIRWLKSFLDDRYRVHSVPLVSDVLHLDCALCLPREGLAVICSAAFQEGIPNYFKDWDLIDVSLEEASYLACNGLIIDEKRIICGTEHTRIIKELEAAGQEVIPLPFDAVSQFGGGLRCAHHPIIRMS